MAICLPALALRHNLSGRLDRSTTMSALGLGRMKTKSDLLVMPSGRQIFAFLALRMTIGPKIPGAVIPRRVFTQPGSEPVVLWSSTRFPLRSQNRTFAR